MWCPPRPLLRRPTLRSPTRAEPRRACHTPARPRTPGRPTRPMALTIDVAHPCHPSVVRSFGTSLAGRAPSRVRTLMQQRTSASRREHLSGARCRRSVHDRVRGQAVVSPMITTNAATASPTQRTRICETAQTLRDFGRSRTPISPDSRERADARTLCADSGALIGLLTFTISARFPSSRGPVLCDVQHCLTPEVS